MAQSPRGNQIVTRPLVVDLNPDEDPFLVLGVDPSATDDEIKGRLRKLFSQLHPDHLADDPAAAAKFDAVKKAMKRIENLRVTNFKFFEGKKKIEVLKVFDNGDKSVRIFFGNGKWDEGVLGNDGLPKGPWSHDLTEEVYREQILSEATLRYKIEADREVRALLEEGRRALGLPKVNYTISNVDLEKETERIFGTQAPIGSAAEQDLIRAKVIEALAATPYNREEITGLVLPGTSAEKIAHDEAARSRGLVKVNPDALGVALRSEVGSDKFSESPFAVRARKMTLRYFMRNADAMNDAMKDPDKFLETLQDFRYDRTLDLRNLPAEVRGRFQEIIEYGFKSKKYRAISAEVYFAVQGSYFQNNMAWSKSVFKAVAENVAALRYLDEDYDRELWRKIAYMKDAHHPDFESYLQIAKNVGVEHPPKWAQAPAIYDPPVSHQSPPVAATLTNPENTCATRFASFAQKIMKTLKR